MYEDYMEYQDDELREMQKEEAHQEALEVQKELEERWAEGDWEWQKQRQQGFIIENPAFLAGYVSPRMARLALIGLCVASFLAGYLVGSR